jgi:hypothetical protein
MSLSLPEGATLFLPYFVFLQDKVSLLTSA